MKRYELIVIGAGPAGLSAAITAASRGMKTAVFDENAKPGGQLFKQIHKFFGSKEHKAKIRGFRIGEELLDEAAKAGVEVFMHSTVIGIYPNLEINVMRQDEITHFKADNIIIATGASENMIPFAGWTLPGVIGAGAAQTMMNLHGVKPGEKILMVGSGNVGLVVSFQLEQAGCQIAAVIDAAPRIGGYGVHAAKVARTGVPFILSHTIVKAEGTDHVTGAVIAQVDEKFKKIPGTERHLDVDTICLAVGLSPMSQLAKMAGCKMLDTPVKGGAVPVTDEYNQTTVAGIFAAGDVAGIEEASAAMITGKIAALGALRHGGYLDDTEFMMRYTECKTSLNQLRDGMFSHENKGRTDLVLTDEGFALSANLLKKGFLLEEEFAAFPNAAVPDEGVFPVIECTQNIPCNPCQEACKKGCIKVGNRITGIPERCADSQCTGCGMCVASCPGQAIFLVNKSAGTVAVPYEFLPLPAVGEQGTALDRAGNLLCAAEVVGVKKAAAMDKTAVLTMKVPVDMVMQARFFKAGGNV